MGLAYERSKEIYTEHIVRHSRSHDPAKGCVLPLLTHLRVLDLMFPRKDMARRKRLWVLSKAEWPWPQLAPGLAVITQPGLCHPHAFTLAYCFSNTSLIRPREEAVMTVGSQNQRGREEQRVGEIAGWS